MCIKDKDYSWSINADGEVVIYFSKQSDTVLELASMMKGSCCKFLIKSAEKSNYQEATRITLCISTLIL